MPTNRKILVILGHSFPDTYCEALVRAYQEGALRGGAEVRVLNLKELSFDPILRSLDHALEPDLVEAQKAILWSDHLTFVYPTWWGAAPALLKGFIDRAFVSGFAYRFHKDKFFPDALLKGRSSRLLITMDVPGFVNTLLTRQPQKNAMTVSTLELTGVKPVKVNFYCDVRTSTPEQRERWLRSAEKSAMRDAVAAS